MSENDENYNEQFLNFQQNGAPPHNATDEGLVLSLTILNIFVF